VAAVAAGLAIAVVAHPGPLPGEVRYVEWWQRLGEPVPSLADSVWWTTGTEAALVVAAAAAIWLFARREHRRHGAVVIVVAAVTMLVVQPLVKQIVDRPRPGPELVSVRAETQSPSFPSGHSMSTTTVWGAAAALAWRRRRTFMAIAAATPIVLTFFAGAVQGAHWPTDAIAGTLMGAAAATGAMWRLDQAGDVRP
jgi:membrane-associated phospholipid phosphatase